MSRDDTLVTRGLATIRRGHLEVMERLDTAICAWGIRCGAENIRFPLLQAVSDLEKIDYFKNFPHLGVAAAPIARSNLPNVPLTGQARARAILPGALEGAAYLLPSAACYPVYSFFGGKVLFTAALITTVQQCFRNEQEHDGLRRLLGFTMREIVAIGTQVEIRDFLRRQKDWISRFASGSGLQLSVHLASDPFFETAGSRARMQQLFPVKEEFHTDHSVALSSVNFHRNFFAERWNIRLSDDSYAFSGCVAFGLERWLDALLGTYSDDLSGALRAIEAGAACAHGC